MDRAVIADLVERVKAAQTADRVLEAHIICALLAPEGAWVALSPIMGVVRIVTGKNARGADEGWPDWPFWVEQRVTSSIGAADALIDRVLPGWSRESGRSGFGNPAWCQLWNPMRSPGQGNDIRADHDGGSEAMARIAALLTALSEGGSHAGN